MTFGYIAGRDLAGVTAPEAAGPGMSAYPSVTALVTGGASGIGAATAARLRAAGVRVVTADLAPGADEKLDVTDPAAVDALRAALGPGRDPGQQRRRRRPVPVRWSTSGSTSGAPRSA